ncbi:MAG TPA: response regulator transcription factor [Anaerolineales bacterium]|nr:response regulator transcription factor [Anaerolineales bacterium]
MNKINHEPIRFVIVDDHVLFREGLLAIIRSEPDLEIVGQAGSVKEAVAMIGSLKPDVVLMDFRLPDGTGVDATRAVLSEYPECKIVFLTMSEEDDDLFSAVRSGAKGYLLKNMHPSKLVATIKSVYEGESALSRSMTLRLMEELSRTKAPQHTGDPTLTRRQLDVLRELASGFSNSEIAEHLFISENTVKYHVHSILDKLGLSDRREAAEYAKKHGLAK